ncbi:MAG: TIGR01459 family HAD-type hydrolase [Rhizobiaceae bacterium]
MAQRISGLKDISDQYRAILCDVWGVLHNGQSVYRAAEDALMRYREAGGRVVLLTNSPRPNEGVSAQLDDLRVDRTAYDAIVTSGDVTRTLIAQAPVPIYHLGPQRDLPLFNGLNVELVDQANCKAVVCTGLFEDEVEKPDDYRSSLQALANLDVPFICANPDLVVERGDRLIYCAGSLAKLYNELGGKTLVAGKPHAPIYRLAVEKLASLGDGEITQAEIIAIGDGMPTDVAGALGNGFDLLYISAGIHSQEYGPADNPDEEALQRFLSRHQADPNAWMPRLSWAAA